MKIAAIVQARMTSKRLPCKVMLRVGARPMLGFLLERLRDSKKIDRVIVATSTDTTDQVIADYCKDRKVECFRGALDNVAKRFKEVIECYAPESFIRICGDSPLIDGTLVDSGIEIFERGRHEILTNVLKYTFPHGQNFEILRSDTFLRGFKSMSDPQDLEHVTRYFYRNAGQFRIFNMTADKDYSSVNLCVDTREDFEVFQAIVGQMDKPLSDYRWQELIKMYEGLKKQSEKR